MSKLKDPDFLNIFQNYDILFFQETKTDNLDHLSLPDGFTYVAKHRKKCLRKSGGIVTIFKKSLARLLEFPDTSSEYVQWVKIDSSIFGTDKNVLLGNIYIPPENTKYSC
jgi:exonuclease III